MPNPTSSHRPSGWEATLLAALLLAPIGLLAWSLADRPAPPSSLLIDTGRGPGAFSPGPPWLYGKAGARYTLTLHADLECPYCKNYFPILKSWIDKQPDTTLEWSHLPLSIHEPAATELALLAECVGDAEGHAAFWNAAAWIYRHTRSDGRGLPTGASYPGITPAVKACATSERAKSVIRAQAQAAAAENIVATPTVKLHDNETGRSLLLPGPVDGDALLSAIDLVSADEISARAGDKLPADFVGKPR